MAWKLWQMRNPENPAAKFLYDIELSDTLSIFFQMAFSNGKHENAENMENWVKNFSESESFSIGNFRFFMILKCQWK